MKKPKPDPPDASPPDPRPPAAAEAPIESAPLPQQLELLADRGRAKGVLEAILMASDRPVSLERIAEVAGASDRIRLRELLAELTKDYERLGRAFTIAEVAGGFLLATRPEYGGYLRRLFKARSAARLTRSAIETLAVIAYRQPVTRAEIEQVRGVNIESVLQTLLERRLIRLAGRKEVPGRPLTYAITPEMLQRMGLNSTADLPQLKEMDELMAGAHELQEFLPFDVDELRADQRGSRQLLALIERHSPLDVPTPPTPKTDEDPEP